MNVVSWMALGYSSLITFLPALPHTSPPWLNSSQRNSGSRVDLISDKQTERIWLFYVRINLSTSLLLYLKMLEIFPEEEFCNKDTRLRTFIHSINTQFSIFLDSKLSFLSKFDYSSIRSTTVKEMLSSMEHRRETGRGEPRSIEYELNRIEARNGDGEINCEEGERIIDRY